MVAAFSPTEDDKKNGLEHVCYEIEQLLECFCLLKSSDILSTAIKNAIVESAITHIRNLYEFYTKKRSSLNGDYTDNIVSEDYRFELNSTFSSFANLKYIHKRLSHISYKRTINYQWPNIDSMSIEIFKASRWFIDHLIGNQGNTNYDHNEKLHFLKGRIAELTASTENPSATQIPATLSPSR